MRSKSVGIINTRQSQKNFNDTARIKSIAVNQQTKFLHRSKFFKSPH